MIDANMGNTLNGAKALLDLCADVIYWFENPLPGPPLNQAEGISDRKRLGKLVADGEFAPHVVL